MIAGAPQTVVAAAERLSFTSAVIVNLGVDRPDVSEAHVSYVYDDDIIFPRLNFPHLLSPNNVPPGHGKLSRSSCTSPTGTVHSPCSPRR